MGTEAAEKKVRYWQRHVEAFKASGLTRKAYSRQAQINIYKLDYWRKKLSGTDTTPEAIPVGQWIPLKISEDETAERAPHIDLWIGRIRVEVKHGFDSRLLAEILRTVDAL